MPYELKREGSGYYVMDDAGKKYSAKPLPRKDAIAQMRALYASEKKEKGGIFSFLNYKKYEKAGLPREDYAGKNQSFPIEVPKDVADAARSIGRAGDDNYSTDELKKRIIAIAKRKGPEFEDELPKAWQEVDDKKELEGSVFVTKEASGKYRWTIISSNAFRDTDRQIITTKALENDVDASDTGGYYGPIRWWHVPNLDIGDCDFRMVWGHTLLESGLFYDEDTAIAVKENADKLRVSIGFFHPKTEPNKNGEFDTIRTYERSLLPAGKEANPLTRILKENNMASLKEKLDALAGLVGTKKAAEIIAGVEGLEKAAAEIGVDFKEADETDEVAPDVTDTATETATDNVTDTEVKEADVEVEVEKPDVIGNMTVEKFSELVAGLVAKQLETVNKKVADTKKEAEDHTSEVATLKENLAGYETKLAQQEASHAEIVSGLNSEMTKLKERLSALEGEVPSAAKGYVASEANDNLIEKERAEQNMPHTDPLLDTLSFFTGQKP